MGRRRVGRQKGRGSAIGMPVAAWPAPDRAAWQAAIAGSDNLDCVVDCSWMAENTRASLITAYAKWLVWLKAEHPEALVWPPGERARKDWVLGFLETLRAHLKPSTMLTNACSLRAMLAVVAPGSDQRWFDRIIDNLNRMAERQAPKARASIPVGELYDFGVRLMQTAGANLDEAAVAVAEQFRDGLIFAFLAMRPLRSANLVGIRIGQELVTTSHGFRVSIAAEACKTNEPFEFAVPEQLVRYLQLYIDAHRPVLAAGGSPKGGMYLWLYRSGAPLRGQTLRMITRSRSEPAFGVAINPHDFRHCAASSIAEASPDEMPIIKSVLGHRTLQTSQRHYVHAKGVAIAKDYQNLIEKRIREAARSCVGGEARRRGRDQHAQPEFR